MCVLYFYFYKSLFQKCNYTELHKDLLDLIKLKSINIKTLAVAFKKTYVHSYLHAFRIHKIIL